MDLDQIGQQGQELNNSVASRAINMEADDELLKQYDPYSQKHLRTSRITFFVGLLCLGAAIKMIAGGSWIIGILLILLTLGLWFAALATKGLALGIAYQQGLLVPSIVVNTNPIQIVVLAPLQGSDALPPLNGAKKITVTHLPLHEAKVGEKVPCVSLFGGNQGGYYTNFEPRVMSWGIGSKEAIERAISEIDEEEWEFLEAIKNAIPEGMKDHEVACFNMDYTFKEVR